MLKLTLANSGAPPAYGLSQETGRYKWRCFFRVENALLILGGLRR